MERLKRALFYFAIGFVPAIVIMIHWRGDVGAFVFGILLMGLPSGYCFIGRHFGHISAFGSIGFTIGFFLIKMIISAVIGWIEMPIDILVGIFEAVHEHRMIRRILS